MNIVKQEIIKRAPWALDPSIAGLNRIIKYTPAVTRVDECTKADTGVGAAMAAGSQAEKGIWALLVIAATISSTFNINHSSVKKSPYNTKFHLPSLLISPILSRIATSPIRLDRIVNIPALADFSFW